jgi:hypothetical protein
MQNISAVTEKLGEPSLFLDKTKRLEEESYYQLKQGFEIFTGTQVVISW